MEVRGPGGASGPRRVEPRKVSASKAQESARPGSPADRVQLSEHARLLELLSRVPAIRADKVEELRRLIELGEYETPERIEGAVERLLAEL